MITLARVRRPSPNAAPDTHFEEVFKSLTPVPLELGVILTVVLLGSPVFGLESEEVVEGLSLLPSELLIVFVTLSTSPFPFLAANAEPAKPLTTMSDEAMQS